VEQQALYDSCDFVRNTFWWSYMPDVTHVFNHGVPIFGCPSDENGKPIIHDIASSSFRSAAPAVEPLGSAPSGLMMYRGEAFGQAYRQTL